MIRRLLIGTAIAFCAVAAHAQATLYPFQPTDNTDSKQLAVTGTAANITVPGGGSGAGLHQILVQVIGTQVVYFRCDGTTATTSGAGMGTPIQPGVAYIISLTYDKASCSAIASSTGSTLVMSLGAGQ